MTLLEELLTTSLLEEVPKPSSLREWILLLCRLIIRVFPIIEPLSQFYSPASVDSNGRERRGRTWVEEDFVGLIDSRHLLLRSSLLIWMSLQSSLPTTPQTTSVPSPHTREKREGTY